MINPATTRPRWRVTYLVPGGTAWADTTWERIDTPADVEALRQRLIETSGRPITQILTWSAYGQ